MKNLYPVGTVVELNGSDVMVVGLLVKKDAVLYDYVGVHYPVGFTSHEEVLQFNHDQITKLKTQGGNDDESEVFIGKINEYVNSEKVKKGKGIQALHALLKEGRIGKKILSKIEQDRIASEIEEIRTLLEHDIVGNRK